MKRLLLSTALLLAAAAAHTEPVEAQTDPRLDFNIRTSTNGAGLTPTLEWRTEPAATSCTASGDSEWSGTKEPQGEVALATSTTSKQYSLSCAWGRDFLTLTWTPPTTNTDGSQLTDLTGYRIFYGTSPTMSQNTVVELNNPALARHVVEDLQPGTYYFVVAAVNSQGLEGRSPVVSGSLAPMVTVTRSASLVVNPPSAPSNVSVE